MRSDILAVLTAVTLLAGSAAADTSTPATPDASTAPSPPPDPLICVQGTPETGSHLPGSKECHTRAEWDQIHSANADAARQYLRNYDIGKSQIGH